MEHFDQRDELTLKLFVLQFARENLAVGHFAGRNDRQLNDDFSCNDGSERSARL
jgi:hypothetical protein